MDNPKKTVKNKLQVIDEVLKSDDNKTFEMSVSDFKALFSTAQLNRGWTKPQLENLLERLK
ncbi:MAG: hypothetical protein CMI73_04855 [Candidatus Pelagibacter sp.]|nr:hypothetical protein [Candidatus Pelagibacter sp.]